MRALHAGVRSRAVQSDDARSQAGRSQVAGPRAVRARAGALLAAVPLLAVALAGCGIRTTTVPVDAGPAPSRVSCALPKVTGTAAPNAEILKVYLVCSSQAAPVSRNVARRAGPVDRLEAVRELMTQLQRSTLPAETAAGFVSEVPGSLVVEGPWPDDPKQALRLTQPPDLLPSFALAQIVCTLAADPMIAPSGSVVLGGIGLHEGLRSYTCTQDLRSRADAADTAGTPVG